MQEVRNIKVKNCKTNHSSCPSPLLSVTMTFRLSHRKQKEKITAKNNMVKKKIISEVPSRFLTTRKRASKLSVAKNAKKSLNFYVIMVKRSTFEHTSRASKLKKKFSLTQVAFSFHHFSSLIFYRNGTEML